jgi:hypothetical protein
MTNKYGESYTEYTMSRINALKRIIAIGYLPIPLVFGFGLGVLLSGIFLIPSILRHLITGEDPDPDKETVRRRLIMWPERVRTFAATGEGEMHWTP